MSESLPVEDGASDPHAYCRSGWCIPYVEFQATNPCPASTRHLPEDYKRAFAEAHDVPPTLVGIEPEHRGVHGANTDEEPAVTVEDMPAPGRGLSSADNVGVALECEQCFRSPAYLIVHDEVECGTFCGYCHREQHRVGF